MSTGHRGPIFTASCITALLAGLNAASAKAQEPLDGVSSAPPPGVYSLTLEEAKQRALCNSKLRSLAYMNIKAKQEGIYVMEADYYPKLLAGFMGFHFDRRWEECLHQAARLLRPRQRGKPRPGGDDHHRSAAHHRAAESPPRNDRGRGR